MEERIAAACALGNLGSSEAAPALIEALDDPAWQVRAQAARSLGRLAATKALHRLERATTDMAWWVRRNACYALTDLGAAGVTALARIRASSPDPYAREMAGEALQALEWEQQSPGGIGRVG
ncbi:MAG: HEAT repeat domain-containing protein [Candidatus Eisenbacteria bacterium]|uniref:HEAT repeat domain-containing protein n=1 Tax=Eiseniibacteriota bacterium TaxID=2212470 RepID=A0A538U1Y7_UNCEI|nr:MAG: HEAT repeat domain-containing protein [Candidatus Eisenbacteria bacterium]